MTATLTYLPVHPLAKVLNDMDDTLSLLDLSCDCPGPCPQCSAVARLTAELEGPRRLAA